MTIEEAIDRLDNEVECSLHQDDLKSLEAVRLGIEALKAYANYKRTVEQPYQTLLPGETED